MESLRTKRRAFMKMAAITPFAGLRLPGVAVGEENITNPLQTELRQLSEEGKSELVLLLSGLREKEIPLVGGMGRSCLSGAETTWKFLCHQAAQEIKLEEMLSERDSLSGQAKLDYVTHWVAERQFIAQYAPSFQRRLLKHIAEGRRPPKDWRRSGNSTDAEDFGRYHEAYGLNQIWECLEGTDTDFQRRFVKHYSDTILPRVDAEYERDMAEQDALDDFVALISDMDAEETTAFTAQIKQMTEFAAT